MMSKVLPKVAILVIALTLITLIPVIAQGAAAPDVAPAPAQDNIALAPSAPVTLTLLHTNDFHGNLESDYRGRGGSAYMANVINDIRDTQGEENVVLLDAGDVFLGAPAISQLLLGESTIDIYNMIGYDAAAFGNHEFDKGQTVLISRTNQSNFPWVGANIVISGTEWTHPDWVHPYVTMTVGMAGDQVTLGILGLDTDETPLVTIKGATEGLEFKDMTETVLHYYDEVMAESDAMIVLAHMGTEDSGGFKGLQTVAQELATAGKPVDLMIGGHQHQALEEPLMVGDTAIIQAGSYGRYLGHAKITVDPDTKTLAIADYELITINNTLTPDPDVEARVAYWAEQVAPYINQVVGHTYIDLERDYNHESIMGDLVTDGMLWKADQYDDGEINGSVDIALTNPGGLRADIEITGTLPYTITWGDTFTVLPFGNKLFYMDLTGAQVQTLLNQAARLYKGMMQASGITFYWYNDDHEAYEPEPTMWGAYGAMVGGEPLDPDAVYRVVTNDFLAGGQDGWVTFAEGTNRWDSYYDMQEGVNEYIATITPIEASDIITERMVLTEPTTDLSTSTKVVEDASGDGMAQAGEILTFTITLTNSGTANAAIMLVDALPTGLAYVEGSLDWFFPGTAGLFDAVFEDNVLTAQTLNFGSLVTPESGSLLPASKATITFAAQVSRELPGSGQFSNKIELQDQYVTYNIPPVVIPIKYQIFLPSITKGYNMP